MSLFVVLFIGVMAVKDNVHAFLEFGQVSVSFAVLSRPICEGEVISSVVLESRGEASESGNREGFHLGVEM